MADPKQAPKTVSELFPSKWLTWHDIAKVDKAKLPLVVTIQKVDFDQVARFNRRTKTNENQLAAILTLALPQRTLDKRFIVNKTQADAIAKVVGTEAFSEWAGHQIALNYGETSNKQFKTIIVEEPPTTKA